MKIFISVVNKVLYTERLRLEVQPLTLFMYHFLTEKILLKDLSEVSRGKGGGGEVETEGGSQLFETQKREGS